MVGWEDQENVRVCVVGRLSGCDGSRQKGGEESVGEIYRRVLGGQGRRGERMES